MKIFPVVHINERETAVEQANLALSYGADGVYLIDHHSAEEKTTFNVLDDIKTRDESAFVGVNFLGYDTDGVFDLIDYALATGQVQHIPDAVWLDNVSRTEPLEKIRAKYERLSKLRVLGGVAFKYTSTYTENPDLAKREVVANLDRTDVITTSGSGTGTPPTIAKIAAMKDASEKPIALASGVDVDNIADYKGIADEILAASSVETHKYSGIFDQEKLKELIDRAHQL